MTYKFLVFGKISSLFHFLAYKLGNLLKPNWVLVFHRVSRVFWQMYFHSPFYLAARCAFLLDKRIVYYFVKKMKDMDAVCSLSGSTTATHNSEAACWPLPIPWPAVAPGRWPYSAWGREEDQTRLPGSLLRGRLRKGVANHVLPLSSRSDHGGWIRAYGKVVGTPHVG